MEGAGFPVNSSFFYGSPCTELMFYTQVDSITIVTNTDVKCSLGPGPSALPVLHGALQTDVQAQVLSGRVLTVRHVSSCSGRWEL